jgi:hypothetical protein
MGEMNDACNDYHLFFFFVREEVDISNRDFLIFRGMDIVSADRSDADKYHFDFYRLT